MVSAKDQTPVDTATQEAAEILNESSSSSGTSFKETFSFTEDQFQRRYNNLYHDGMYVAWLHQ